MAGGNFDGTAFGNAGGGENHVLTGSEMPVHNHGVNDPGHAHSYVSNANNANASVIAGNPFLLNDTTLTTGTSVTGISIQNAGGGAAHPQMPPSIVLNYVIVVE